MPQILDDALDLDAPLRPSLDCPHDLAVSEVAKLAAVTEAAVVFVLVFLFRTTAIVRVILINDELRSRPTANRAPSALLFYLCLYCLQRRLVDSP